MRMESVRRRRAQAGGLSFFTLFLYSYNASRRCTGGDPQAHSGVYIICSMGPVAARSGMHLAGCLSFLCAELYYMIQRLSTV